MVPWEVLPDDCIGLLAILCNLHRTALHLCKHVGSSDLHSVRDIALRFHPIDHRDELHQRGVALLPVGARGPPVVVEHIHQRGNDGFVYLRLLFLLLFPPKRDVGNAPIVVLLRVYVDHFVRILSDVGKCWVPPVSLIHQAHLLSC